MAKGTKPANEREFLSVKRERGNNVVQKKRISCVLQSTVQKALARSWSDGCEEVKTLTTCELDHLPLHVSPCSNTHKLQFPFFLPPKKAPTLGQARGHTRFHNTNNSVSKSVVKGRKKGKGTTLAQSEKERKDAKRSTAASSKRARGRTQAKP